MKLRISEIREVALKHPGMWDALFRAGRKEGDLLEIDRKRFDRIMAAFFPRGAGTILHKVLKPVVAVVDSVAGTNLQDCGGCGEREIKLNG